MMRVVVTVNKGDMMMRGADGARAIYNEVSRNLKQRRLGPSLGL